MFETIQNEDQLAIILSHELSHAILGHSVRKIKKNFFFCTGDFLAGNSELDAISRLVSISGGWIFRRGRARDLDRGVVNGQYRESSCESTYFLYGLLILAHFFQITLSLPYNRELEKEADDVGLQ